jgi:hypothetical protein
MKTTQDLKVAEYWNHVAHDFDAIYTGKDKSGVARALDKWLRRDIYERFDWVMRKSGNVQDKTICDIGCGPQLLVTDASAGLQAYLPRPLPRLASAAAEHNLRP